MVSEGGVPEDFGRLAAQNIYLSCRGDPYELRPTCMLMSEIWRSYLVSVEQQLNVQRADKPRHLRSPQKSLKVP